VRRRPATGHAPSRPTFCNDQSVSGKQNVLCETAQRFYQMHTCPGGEPVEQTVT